MGIQGLLSTYHRQAQVVIYEREKEEEGMESNVSDM